MIRSWLLIPSLMSCTAHHRSQVDAGQAPDREFFDAWLADAGLTSTYLELVAHLEAAEVREVAEPWHLLRQGTDWETIGHPPFAMPPPEQWDAIVPTLIFIRDQVEPVTGPVEVVSGYRSDAFNASAGGSPNSRHKFFEAVDLVPMQRTRRRALHQDLQDTHGELGEESQIGLGLYENTRFHIDTWKFRSW